MKHLVRIHIVLALLVFSACKKEVVQKEPENSLYFPPLNSGTWETTAPDQLNWKLERLEDLYSFLEENNTRAFIILKDGKLVVEKYWGKNLVNTGDFTRETNWYWASAGKTITAFLVGIAQENGYLNISDKTSDYLGKGWTNMPEAKENLITIKHQLTMTTGLDYTVEDIYCTNPECLNYKADAGTQWYYHNAPYTLLDKVVSNATQTDYNVYTDKNLEQKIGMNGTWIKSGFNNVYYSTARDAARFGLLILNKGNWGDEQILSDLEYFEAMVNSSQNLNPAYGYLWWLNGKSSIILPGLPVSLNFKLSENAPDDLFAAMGKNGQFVEVIPGKNMVVVRMGEAPDNALVPVVFHNEMWAKIMDAISN